MDISLDQHYLVELYAMLDICWQLATDGYWAREMQEYNLEAISGFIYF